MQQPLKPVCGKAGAIQRAWLRRPSQPPERVPSPVRNSYQASEVPSVLSVPVFLASDNTPMKNTGGTSTGCWLNRVNWLAA
jgi:hypothetical protein